MTRFLITFGLCTFSLVLVVNSSSSTSKKYYQMRNVRDVFPDSGAYNNDDGENPGSGPAAVLKVGRKGGVEANTQRIELLKLQPYDGHVLFKLLSRSRRSYHNLHRYYNEYDDNDDDDYAGYDRQGSDVGYMEKHDDFPTVVW